MKVKTIVESIVNYLRVIEFEYNTAHGNKSYMKGHRRDKRKLMKAYLYTNKLK